jgi:hypothetical protein
MGIEEGYILGLTQKLPKSLIYRSRSVPQAKVLTLMKFGDFRFIVFL